MRPLNESRPYYELALSEHHHLHQCAHCIQLLLESRTKDSARPADVAEVLGLLEKLACELKGHFEQEEEGGYLEEAITRLPSIAPQAAQLQKQHAELLELAKKAIADAKAQPKANAAWEVLNRDVGVYLKKLLAHEAGENRLLQLAFNEDMGEQ
jgi:hemerythrin